MNSLILTLGLITVCALILFFHYLLLCKCVKVAKKGKRIHNRKQTIASENIEKIESEKIETIESKETSKVIEKNLCKTFGRANRVSIKHMLFKHWDIKRKLAKNVWIVAPGKIQNQEYVLKIFKFKKDYYAENEAHVHALLSANNLAPRFIKDYQLNDDTGCIIMEYCDRHVDLFNSFIDDKAGACRDHAKIINVMISAAQKLAKIHELGFMHLDIKPENIFITNDNEVQIGDFGFTRESQSLQIQNIGTKYHMAPEILLPKRKCKYTNKCDVWSLGCTFFSLMSQRYPFNTRAITQQVEALRLNLKTPLPHGDLCSNLDGVFKDICEYMIEHVFVPEIGRVTAAEFACFLKTMESRIKDPTAAVPTALDTASEPHMEHEHSNSSSSNVAAVAPSNSTILIEKTSTTMDIH